MNWYNIAEAPADKAKFLVVDISYYPAFLEIHKKTKRTESFASYIDRKNNLLSEFMEESDKTRKAEFGLKYFSNLQNFLKYKKDIQSVIMGVNEYKKNFDKIDLGNIDFKKNIKLFESAKVIYRKALGSYLISQPEYTAQIEEKTKEKLLEFVPANELEKVLMILTTSKDKSCLENERFEWLKNVVLPAIKKHKSIIQAKKDREVLKNINKQVNKYKYYSAGVEFGLWEKEHYLKLLKDDLEINKQKLNKEFLKIENKSKLVQGEKDKVIKKYKISSELIKITKIISELGILRINLRILGWQFFNYLFPLLIENSAKQLKVDSENLGDLTYKDYANLLKGNLNKSILKQSKNRNTLVIISNKKGYEIYRGIDADKKFNNEIKQKIGKVEEFKGTVAHKKGIIKGKVFLFKWGSKNFNQRIYKFPKDYILVAGQTKPLLMPAIRKAKVIITDEGGLLCHAAIISRELKIPCIIGTKIATKILEDGVEIEVDTNNGIVKIIKQ